MLSTGLRACRFVGFLLVISGLGHSNAKESAEDDQGTLELVMVIFRHGNRTTLPQMIYPADRHINDVYYPYGKGELTAEGKRNSYDLGLEIRERYNHFLNETYFPSDVKGITSDTSRTQMTLQLVLAAMYPPIYPNLIRSYLMWQPISYQILQRGIDNYLEIICQNLLNFTTILDEKEVKLYEYVAQHAGMKINHSNDMMNVYDTILVEKQNGFEVPDWAKEIFENDQMRDAALTLWTDLNAHSLPLLVGKLVKKITDDCRLKMRNELPNQIFLYSGHDTNIAGLLGLFDAYSSENKFEIEYLAHFYIELHRINGDYAVRVFFKNGPGHQLVQLKFKLCVEDFCAIEDFIISTEHVYKTNSTCQYDLSKSSENDHW